MEIYIYRKSQIFSRKRFMQPSYEQIIVSKVCNKISGKMSKKSIDYFSFLKQSLE